MMHEFRLRVNGRPSALAAFLMALRFLSCDGPKRGSRRRPLAPTRQSTGETSMNLHPLRPLFAATLFGMAAGCSGPALAAQAAAGCFDPVSYGAIANDGRDDREAAQRAIDAASVSGGDVCFGSGVWDLTRSPPGTYNRFAALSVHAPRVNIRGAGKFATILKMSGDVGGSTAWTIALDPGTDGTTISDLAIDTAQTTHQDEQSHAIAIGTGVCAGALCAAPVANVTVQRVRFNHPVRAGERKGDCIRVAGNTPATQAKNIKLLDLDILSCARSGIAMQRNVNGLIISRSYFDGDSIGASMIDGEATGGEGDMGLVIADNILWRTAPGGDSYGLALTSQAHFSVHDNVFIGRGATCVRCADGSIHHNTFDVTDALAETGVIDLANLAERVSVGHNQIRRRGGPGSCIKVVPHSGVFPGPVDITHNECSNETDGAAILLDSVRDAGVDGNILAGSGGPNSMGIYVQGSRGIENLSITGNKIRGMPFAAVRLVSSAAASFVATTVGLNTSRSSGPGLYCDNPQLIPPGGIVQGLNNWSAAAVCAAP
jgi:hypothetical protein